MKFKQGDKVLVKKGISLSSKILFNTICTVEQCWTMRMAGKGPAYKLVEEPEHGGGVWEDELEPYNLCPLERLLYNK